MPLYSVTNPQPFTYSVGPTGSGADYTYNGSDIAVAINAAITALSSTGGSICVLPGAYTQATTINMRNKSNISLFANGLQAVVITLASSSIVALNCVNTTGDPYRYKHYVAGITWDNTAPTAGSVGARFGLVSDSYYQNVVFKNFEKGLDLTDGMFYNVFVGCKTEDCVKAVTLTSGSTDKPNSNQFLGCKFLCSASVVNTPYTVNTLTINDGNQNAFIECQFENFVRAIYLNDIGNSFTNNRIESNSVSAAVTYVSIGSSGKNNGFVNNYYSGDDWVDTATSIVDGGAGNSFIDTNSFKDQSIRADRNLVTAGEFVHYTRSGSGDGLALHTAEDTYSSSGSPINYQAKAVRTASKLYSGTLSGTENFYVTGPGIGYFAGGVTAGHWSETDYPFKSWAYDPISAVNNSIPTGGLLQLVQLKIPASMTITHVYLFCGTVGNGTTNAYAALYNSSGTLLAQSDDQSANMGTTGLKTFTLSSPQPVTAGFVYVAFWATASVTVPAFSRGAGSTITNAILGTTYRYSTADAGLTNVAPSPLGAKTSGAIAYWLAID